jgi:hypothetical protein
LAKRIKKGDFPHGRQPMRVCGVQSINEWVYSFESKAIM